MTFTDKMDLKLIRHVRFNPIVYDFNHEHYMDFNEREVVWQKIGDELRRPASDCKARWINIRDIYRRQLRRQLNSPSARMKTYKYDNELLFLRPFFRDVAFQNVPFEKEESNNQDSIVNNDDSHDNYFSDGSSEDEPIKKKPKSPATFKKRKKKRILKVENPESSFGEPSTTAEFDTTNAVDSFLISIGATLKTFSPYRLNLAKSQIFTVVQEHDLKQIVEKQNQGVQSEDMKICNVSVDPIYQDDNE